MPSWLRKCWPFLKVLFTAAVLVFVARQFARDLSREELRGTSIRISWLALGGFLYLLGIGFSGWFWRSLLTRCGQTISVPASLRAYYLGHFGKYVPGKAWALILRVGLARSAGVHAGAAAITAFYEVLASMLAGVITAAVLFAFLAPASSGFHLADFQDLVNPDPVDPRFVSRDHLVLLSLGLVGLLGIPLVPVVFNRLTKPLWVRFADDPAHARPVLDFRDLARGVALASLGWLCLGASLWTVFRGIGVPLTFDVSTWGWCVAAVSFSYVMGFVVVLVPNGLGIREYFLNLLVVSAIAPVVRDTERALALSVVGVVLLRLVWTAAEVLWATVLVSVPILAKRIDGSVSVRGRHAPGAGNSPHGV
jgi:hypothetical protein